MEKHLNENIKESFVRRDMCDKTLQTECYVRRDTCDKTLQSLL